MNLQSTINQGFSSFPVFNLLSNNENTKSLFDDSKQKKQLLEAEKIEPKQKDNLVLSRDVIAIIGVNGKRRFDEFKSYPDNWYGGKGKKLSNWSVSIFESFIKNLPELRLFRPSLFLTLGGNLSLSWEDKKGNSIEVEFYPNKIEYYLESANEESDIKLSDMFLLAEKIRKLLK